MSVEKMDEDEAIDIYMIIYRDEAKRRFKNLQSGERVATLIKKRIEIHSYNDMLKQDKPFIPREDLIQSINISLGLVTQDAASRFIHEVAKRIKGIELVGEKDKKKNKYRFFNLVLDIQPFVIDNVLYLYESKNNIELDKDKTHVVNIRTKKIGDAAGAIQDIHTNGYSVQSLHVIWNKGSGEDAWKRSKKKHIDKESIHGVCDFFGHFVDVTPRFFEKVRLRVTQIVDEEVHAFVPAGEIPLDAEAYLRSIKKQNNTASQPTLKEFGCVTNEKK